MKKSKRNPQNTPDPQKKAEPLEHSDEARQAQEAAWPDLIANLQGAHTKSVPQKTGEPLEH
ncbi:MAG TPA: hypothetical protein VKS99_06750, partial [Blastocatellia bacterium]|nr:hypothetical protein [Blastocatellia bacterium]